MPACITYQYLCSEVSLVDTASIITIFSEPVKYYLDSKQKRKMLLLDVSCREC